MQDGRTIYLLFTYMNGCGRSSCLRELRFKSFFSKSAILRYNSLILFHMWSVTIPSDNEHQFCANCHNTYLSSIYLPIRLRNNMKLNNFLQHNCRPQTTVESSLRVNKPLQRMVPRLWNAYFIDVNCYEICLRWYAQFFEMVVCLQIVCGCNRWIFWSASFQCATKSTPKTFTSTLKRNLPTYSFLFHLAHW